MRGNCQCVNHAMNASLEENEFILIYNPLFFLMKRWRELIRMDGGLRGKIDPRIESGIKCIDKPKDRF